MISLIFPSMTHKMKMIEMLKHFNTLSKDMENCSKYTIVIMVESLDLILSSYLMIYQSEEI